MLVMLVPTHFYIYIYFFGHFSDNAFIGHTFS